jgi:hypothetical protein
MQVRKKFQRRPPFLQSGSAAFALPRRLVELNAEQAVAVEFVVHRRLFGEGYSRLMWAYFRDMPPDSGVFILLFAPTPLLAPAASRPGDIDLLVVPYEGDELVLDRTLAVELKVVRASYERAGKSPNEFGFSQAAALRELGFPYVGVGHLIVSDQSPEEAWQETMTMEVLDQAGNVAPRPSQMVDRLPWLLIERTYGRLIKACPDESLGLLSAFVRHADLSLAAQHKNHIWFPVGRRASPNPQVKSALLEAIAELFTAHPDWWFDTPRFKPEGA